MIGTKGARPDVREKSPGGSYHGAMRLFEIDPPISISRECTAGVGMEGDLHRAMERNLRHYRTQRVLNQMVLAVGRVEEGQDNKPWVHPGQRHRASQGGRTLSEGGTHHEWWHVRLGRWSGWRRPDARPGDSGRNCNGSALGRYDIPDGFAGPCQLVNAGATR